MSAPALRAAFWAALPVALPPGAVVELPKGGTSGWVTVDGELVQVDAVARAGLFKIHVCARGEDRLSPEQAPARCARLVQEEVARRRRAEAERFFREQIALAHRLTDAAGREPDAAPLCLVGLNYTSGALTLDPRLDFTTEQVEATFALWRRLGVLPTLPVPADGEEVAGG